MSDEIYARITFDGHRAQPVASLPGMKERTLTLSGVSKAYAMTGWRVGYFAGPSDLMPALAEIHHSFAISTSAVGQHAALAALTYVAVHWSSSLWGSVGSEVGLGLTLVKISVAWLILMAIFLRRRVLVLPTP